MWRRNAVVVALAWTLISKSVYGQEAPEIESLFASSQWVRFDIVFGRLTALNSLYTKSKSKTRKTADEECVESLCIRPSQGACKIHYERVDSDEQLTVDILNGNQIHIVRESKVDGLPRMQFTQSCDGGLLLEVGSRGATKKYQAETIWHLLFTHPTECQLHLLPTLRVLRPNWRLLERAEQIEQQLVARSMAGAGVDREQLRQLVGQLGAKRYEHRQQADRRLRGMGLRVVAYLDSLNPRRLDAEQRMRIRRIRTSLTISTPDTTERVAIWLTEDRAIWLQQLAHEKSTNRYAAARRLKEICGENIDFDPGLPKEDREAQLARLQARLLNR